MDAASRAICGRLDIEDPRHVEVESKRRVRASQAEELKRHLLGLKGVRHERATSFFDQYLDTPGLDLLRAGTSLRLRYKGDGAHVYLQYKGPGFTRDGVLLRSEFSSERIARAVREESHHDIVHFSDLTVREILRGHADPAMWGALRRHIGEKTLGRVGRGVLLCLYRKDKFKVKLGRGFLEPSLDRIFAFHIAAGGLHALSSFWEYENEAKAKSEDLGEKLACIPAMRKFDGRLARRFDMPAERLDKYHRCMAQFLRRR